MRAIKMRMPAALNCFFRCRHYFHHENAAQNAWNIDEILYMRMQMICISLCTKIHFN